MGLKFIVELEDDRTRWKWMEENLAVKSVIPLPPEEPFEVKMFAKFKFGNGIYHVVGGQSDHIDNTPLTFVAEFLECLHEDAVKWNPYNKVVQCHRCGEQFEPKVYDSLSETKIEEKSN